MTATVEFAQGGLADLPAVMAVMDAAFETRFGEAWTASQCAGLLPMPGVWLTLARSEGAPAGFSLARLVAGEAELLLLAVHPDARGRGVGKCLLEHFLAVAGARGAERLHLEVRDGNMAVRLYSAAGFQVVGRRRGYYRGRDGSNYDALSLARPAAIGGGN